MTVLRSFVLLTCVSLAVASVLFFGHWLSNHRAPALLTSLVLLLLTVVLTYALSRPGGAADSH
jgi:ABC-type maltose transport system permease subunit